MLRASRSLGYLESSSGPIADWRLLFSGWFSLPASFFPFFSICPKMLPPNERAVPDDADDAVVGWWRGVRWRMCVRAIRDFRHSDRPTARTAPDLPVSAPPVRAELPASELPRALSIRKLRLGMLSAGLDRGAEFEATD